MASLTAAINDTNTAMTIMNYRQGTPPLFPTITWVKDALGGDTTTLDTIGPLLTAYTFQYTADIAAVLATVGGATGACVLCLTAPAASPQIVYRQDLTHLGWALGKKALRPVNFDFRILNNRRCFRSKRSSSVLGLSRWTAANVSKESWCAAPAALSMRAQLFLRQPGRSRP